MMVDRERRWALLGLAATAAVLCHLNALANGFALDDVAIIRDNTRVHSLGDLREIWLTPYWPTLGEYLGLWRPLAIFGYALQWAAGGGDPMVFHAVSIALHTIVTILAFMLLERLTATFPAFLGAILFAVHPVHVEAVANVVGQAELLAAAATLGACLQYASRPPGTGVPWRVRLGIVCCFAVAVLAKENAVVLPALLLCVDLAQRRVRLTQHGLLHYVRDTAVPLVMVAGVLGAWLLVRHDVLGGSLTGLDPGPQLHFLREDHRVLNALRAFPEIIRLIVLPWNLAVDYSPAMVLLVDSVTPMVGIGAVVLVGIVLLALATPVHPLIGFPAAWLLVSVITVSNLLFPVGVLIAERTLYLPSLALSGAVASAWFLGAHRLRPVARRSLLAAFGVVIVAFGARSWDRNPVWASTETVQRSLMRENPESYKAQAMMAERLWLAGRPEEARDRFEMALRIYDGNSELHANYGRFLADQGDADAALHHMQRAHAIHPYAPHYVVGLAQMLLQVGRHSEALQLAREAERIGVPYAVTKPIGAAALEGLGDLNGAVAVLRFIVRTAPPEPVPLLFVARQLARLGYPDDALAAVAVARGSSVDPGFFESANRVERAIRTRCYDPANAGGLAQDTMTTVRSIPPPPADCDPLWP
jgi:protein O-mannosyl-transferase